jgi:hypothetical protein
VLSKYPDVSLVQSAYASITLMTPILFQLDAVLPCAGIQREVWFEKPESINLDGMFIPPFVVF